MVICSIIILNLCKWNRTFTRKRIFRCWLDRRNKKIWTSHCQAYKPVIERLAEEEGFKLYFFETDALSQEDSEIVETEYEFETFDDLVPFTFIVKEGEVIAENTGFGGEAEIVKFLLNNGVIK